MGQKRSRRHHYVAESFQKRFCSNANKLGYAERNTAGKIVLEERTPKGCFWEANLNTTLENDTPSDKLEKGFWWALDQDVSELLAEIDQIFASGKIPTIEGEALDQFKLMFATIARRSPDASALPSPVDIGLKYQQKLKSYFQAHGIHGQPKHEDPVWLRQNGRSILAKAKASSPKMVIGALREYVVRWAVPEGKSSFILGSKSVYRAHGGGGSGHLDDPKTQLYWPISPKLALVLLRAPSTQFPMVSSLPTHQVRAWNQNICKTSYSCGSHSQALLRSLLNR